MVIDFDTSALPKGAVGWQRLLEAIENALPGDENLWVEFKANLDPSTNDGRFTVAKAIVAFANRDPLTAAKWLGGHALIVIGLEPGNLVGTPDIDPAALHSAINALLAPPSPVWDATPVMYKGKHVLVITVDPPRQGDPIAVIGKSSGGAEDGHVYVRKIGKSDRAKSADIRRLSARVLSAGRSIDGITISAAEGSQVSVVDYPASWLDDWLHAEEDRLLAPLRPTPPMTPAERRMTEISERVLGKAFIVETPKLRAFTAITGSRTHEENRTEDEFREEVGVYLHECRTNLAKALEDLRQTAAHKVNLKITNTTGTNYDQVLVTLHIEGDVYGYAGKGYFKDLADDLPRAPRKWGSWTENRLLDSIQGDSYPHLLGSSLSESLGFTTPRGPRGPSPTITNGSSVDVTCVPLHLYPTTTTDLLTIRLVGDAPLGEDVRVTWTATASNIDGKLEGAFTIPVAPDSIDLSEALQHTSVQ